MDCTDNASTANEETVVLRSGETVERVSGLLKRGIIEGRYAPGQRLIARDLVEQLGVSRNSLREAFRSLEADGLVDVIPNRGAVVRTMSADQIRHVFQIREALEGFAARTAAANIDRGDNRKTFQGVLALGRSHQSHSRSMFVQFVDDNRDFHQQIAAMSGNPSLCELIDKYQLPVFMLQLRQILSMELLIGNALDEHDAIGQEILSGNADAAYKAMRYHLWHSAEQILSLPVLANTVSVA